MKKFNIILATDITGGFGLNNNIPWKFQIDIDFFKSITKSHTILSGINSNCNILIMGRKTWESMNKKPLHGRISWILTSQYKQLNELNTNNKVCFFPDFYSIYINSFDYVNSDIWIIGGLQIFDEALRHFACDKIYWTQIQNEFETDIKIKLSNYNIKWTNQLKAADLNLNDNKIYDIIFHQGNIIHGLEQNYLSTMFDIIINGEKRVTRNGLTYSLFNKTISWDLAKGFPLLTTKKMFWKGIVEELLFFIRGDTDSSKLSQKGVKIWEPNTNREFLNSSNLNYSIGEMGPMYGYQWRFFNKPFPPSDTDTFQGIDQLTKVIEEIKNDPNSRRILMTDFNPLQVHQGVLYPCHSIIIQFYITNGKLNCSMYQRSADFFLGIPFNIASTSLLVHIISQLTQLQPGIINLIMGDYHLYQDHLDIVFQQINRNPYDLPKLEMTPFETLKQVEESNLNDYKILNYIHHPIIKAVMVA